MKDCLFCRIIKDKIPSTKVYEDKEVLAFNDINPQAPVHILIIPKKHIDKLSLLENEDKELAGHLLLAAKKIAKDKGIDKDGYRIVGNCEKGAGQIVFHIHLHLMGGRKFAWPPG